MFSEDEGQRVEELPDDYEEPPRKQPTRGYRIHIVQVYGPPADANTKFDDPDETEIQYTAEDPTAGEGFAETIAKKLYESCQVRPDDWIEALLHQAALDEEVFPAPPPASASASTFVFQDWQDTQPSTVPDQES